MASNPNRLRLRLVFSGQCLPGHDPQAVRRAVAAALKLGSKHTERLFSGKHIVLKQDVDAAYAAKQIARFAAMGAVLRTEAVRPKAPVQPAPAMTRLVAALGLRWPPDRRTWGAMATSALFLGAVVGVVGWSSLGADGPSHPMHSAAVPPSHRAAPEAASALVPAKYVVSDEDLPRRLTPQAANDYRQQYWPAAWHKAFAVSATGAHVWVVGAQSPAQAREMAVSRCGQSQPAAALACRVVDIDGEPQD